MPAQAISPMSPSSGGNTTPQPSGLPGLTDTDGVVGRQDRLTVAALVIDNRPECEVYAPHRRRGTTRITARSGCSLLTRV